MLPVRAIEQEPRAVTAFGSKFQRIFHLPHKLKSGFLAKLQGAQKLNCQSETMVIKETCTFGKPASQDLPGVLFWPRRGGRQVSIHAGATDARGEPGRLSHCRKSALKDVV